MLLRASEKPKKAGITVFLALILPLLLSLLLGIVESARVKAARAYFSLAAESAAASLFSQYHEELLKTFSLFGLEVYRTGDAEKEYLSFLRPYFQPDSAQNLFSLSMPEQAEFCDLIQMTDRNGTVFLHQISEYMKYGIADAALDLSLLEESGKALRNASASREVSEAYAVCAEEMAALEKTLKSLSEKAEKEQSLREAMESAVSGCSLTDCRKIASELERILRELSSLSETYEREYENVTAKIKEAAQNLAEKEADGSMDSETGTLFSGETAGFSDYSSGTDPVREEIRKTPEKAAENLSLLKKTVRLCEEAENSYRNAGPEEVLAGYEDPPDGIGDPIPVYVEEMPDEHEFWEPAIRCFSAYRSIRFSFSYAEPDPEKEGKFHSVRELLSQGILELVLPKEDLPPAVSFLSSSFPSVEFPGNNTPCSLTERLPLSLYIGSKMHAFEKENPQLSCEIEYILFGSESDRKNLSGSAARLFSVRTGSNLLYLLSDRTRITEAGKLAASIFGAAAATPLFPAVTFLILTTWASGQALLDVRDLLTGGKVPLMHHRESFTLSAEKLLELPSLLKEEGKPGDGLPYLTYLEILLFAEGSRDTLFRTMDMIQQRLCKGQPDFLMSRLLTAATITVTGASYHRFLTIFRDPGTGYPVSAAARYSYP